MPENYVEPTGWAGTPGLWVAKYITGRVEMGVQAFAEQKDFQVWPSQYAFAGGDSEFRANLAALESTKELLKALQPFAALAGLIPPEAQTEQTMRLKVPIKALLAAVEAISKAMPTQKQNSIPYNPKGYL